ncbi:MAG TPA: hypothetical protein VFS28_01200, partial [Gemmatimonadales bacterium]|nr:hypothetical protein [Gemmatimonadales bacterium]
MRTLPLAAALALVAAPAVQAQGLPMPKGVQRTYTAGTRTLDGTPGPNYWTNHARYKVSISTTPPDPRVTGTEELTYTNESPDTLRTLVIRLFPNSHKPGAPRLGGASTDELTSGVHVTAFSVNGTAQPWQESGRYFTWQPVRLPAALAPHQSVTLSFDWWFDLPARPGRYGVIDSTTFYVAYFYPRVAVYDDYNGWDTMDHTSHEFYSDFNDYDVTVTVPANYVVWGTGTLTNA